MSHIGDFRTTFFEKFLTYNSLPNVRFWLLADVLGLPCGCPLYPRKRTFWAVVKNVRFGSKADVLEDGGGLF